LRGRPDCDTCRAVKAEYGKVPDCDKCLADIPPLDFANVDALRVWNLVQDQTIVAADGQVVAINHLAVWRIIDEYEIKDRIKTFEKVLRIFKEEREIMAINREAQTR